MEWNGCFRPAMPTCMRVLINADGSEAEISGNGTRCVASYLAAKGAERSCEYGPGRESRPARWCPAMVHNLNLKWTWVNLRSERRFSCSAAATYRGIPVSMGNPHYVVFVNEFSPEWQNLGAEIGAIHQFPGSERGVCAGKDPSEIEVRFYERGVGETQSSGTGRVLPRWPPLRRRAGPPRRFVPSRSPRRCAGSGGNVILCPDGERIEDVSGN